MAFFKQLMILKTMFAEAVWFYAMRIVIPFIQSQENSSGTIPVFKAVAGRPEPFAYSNSASFTANRSMGNRKTVKGKSGRKEEAQSPL